MELLANEYFAVQLLASTSILSLNLLMMILHETQYSVIQEFNNVINT